MGSHTLGTLNLNSVHFAVLGGVGLTFFMIICSSRHLTSKLIVNVSVIDAMVVLQLHVPAITIEPPSAFMCVYVDKALGCLRI
jgi:hypothetical protein